MLKRVYTILGVYGAVAPFLLAKFSPALFDGWFPRWSRLVSALVSNITSVVPFPVAEILIYAAPVAVPVYWTVSFKRRRDFRRALHVTFVWAGALAAVFVWVWGLNYFCATPSARMGIEPSPATVEELIRTAEYYRDGANRAYVSLDRDFDGLAASVAGGYSKLSEEYGFIHSNPAKPKSLVFGVVQSYLGISGIYMPWTGECCVVGDTPLPNLPATMAHELAHRQGAAPEDEANFLGIIACLASDDPRVQYSGMFYAFIHLSNAVYAHDKEAHAELWRGLDGRVADDLRSVTRHYEQYDGPASEAGEAINDAYLHVMQQPEGVRSYGMVVDLLIAYNNR